MVDPIHSSSCNAWHSLFAFYYGVARTHQFLGFVFLSGNLARFCCGHVTERGTPKFTLENLARFQEVLCFKRLARVAFWNFLSMCFLGWQRRPHVLPGGREICADRRRLVGYPVCTSGALRCTFYLLWKTLTNCVEFNDKCCLPVNKKAKMRTFWQKTKNVFSLTAEFKIAQILLSQSITNVYLQTSISSFTLKHKTSYEVLFLKRAVSVFLVAKECTCTW